ncbi:hypothetical protein [Frigoriglobus tundricola]|uniref:Uncharacterized protein n=1 Tax=Frigoriglobus tundricola TaxID=2774151 RepID=A0A6M5YY94_9BACT|nr:hypothetical protein [Frigoriglobus tundricola]QJW98494.1 hypothetical protein FTUN_6084 [Frigoriglobus tundricola]
MTNDDRPNTAAERGPFQVWHRSGDGFTPVALVHAGNLLAATVFTMNRTDAHWQDGEYVTALVPDARSTNIGDVIVNPEGVAYQIETTAQGLVFNPIDFPSNREQQALFAEWTQDYASARERDVRELFRTNGGGPKPQPEPSRSANDNDRDGGIER